MPAKLLELLNQYQQKWLTSRVPAPLKEGQAQACERIATFVKTTHSCFLRTHAAGHITGSALVASPDLTEVLLTHHKKLDKWLQLGGHSDGDPDTTQVALREAEEESGLTNLEIFDLCPFDLDIHEIPERKNEPTHLHYDVRFLIIAKGNRQFKVSEESNSLAWLSLTEARKLTNEHSMLRQFNKLDWLRSQL